MEIGNSASSSIFDSLPDEIVVCVVDKLGWKDTAKASVLSHRFHHASKFCSAIKNLDFENKFSGNNSRLKFVEFVNHSLQKHQHPKADSLRIAFNPSIYTETVTEEAYTNLNDGYDNWLRFARSKCVENLHIHMNPVCCKLGSNRYASRVCPKFPILEGWDKLTSLSLNIVELADEHLELALKSNLVNLESLHIQNALGLKKVVIDSPKLKKLELIDCSNISIDIVSAPNLTFFRYCFPYVRRYGESLTRRIVDFKGAPKLSHVSLGDGALRRENVLSLSEVEALEKLELLDDLKKTMATFDPPFSNRWDSLTALSLRSIRVNIDALKSHLVNLESLSVQNATNLKDVVIAFPKLKQLEMRDCLSVRSIELASVPNLECFTYQGCSKLRDVLFKDVPKLTHVSLGSGSYCQKSLLELEKVEMLEKLEMKLAPRCNDHEHCVRNPRHFPLLGNLKELECRFVGSEESCIPMILTVILVSCPKLHKLTLNYMTNEESGFSWLELKKDRDCWFGLSEDHLRDGSDMNHRFHLCLKDVKFLGRSTEENKVKAVNYLKRIAPNFAANSTL